VRESATFSGIPLTRSLSERTCGVWVVDTLSSDTVAFLHFEQAVQEILAVAELERALAIRPDFAEAHLSLAMLLLMQGRYKRAGRPSSGAGTAGSPDQRGHLGGPPGRGTRRAHLVAAAGSGCNDGPTQRTTSEPRSRRFKRRMNAARPVKPLLRKSSGIT
jgi:hypothetical protein